MDFNVNHYHYFQLADSPKTIELLGQLKQQLTETENKIMSAISDMHAKVKADYDATQASLDNIATDVAELLAKVEELQNSPGQVSAEDQALLDELETMAASLKSKTKNVADTHPTAPPLPSA